MREPKAMLGFEHPKVLLATFGTLGDIYPFITIAKALAGRGLQPIIAAPGDVREAIESEGIDYAPIRPNIGEVCNALGTDLAGMYKIMRRNPHFILDEIYMRFLRETFEDVCHAANGAAIILSHSLLVGAHLAAEKLGLRCARIALAPLHLQSASSPSVTPSAPYILEPCLALTVGYNRIVRHAVRGAVGLRTRRLRAFRRSLGLRRRGEDLFLDFGRPNSADRIFGMWSPVFAPKQADQPSNLDVVGFPFFAPASAPRRVLEPKLASFLNEGPEPIVFTLGSFVPEVSDNDFYEVSLHAARALGHRAVLLAGPRWAGRIAALAGPTTHICDEAPHALLFPRSICLVHHGGIGTTAEALQAGRPQIVVPFFGDQPDHAARIVRLGVGLALALDRYNVSTSTKALIAVSNGGHRHCASIVANEMKLDPGVTAVADWATTASRRQRLAAQ
jgi:UDP:flavonoid glycosyltransferase YjiC (YdhE family)